MNRKQKRMLLRIIAAAVLIIALRFIPASGYVRFGLYLVPYLIIGHDILRKAWRGIIHRQMFDENFLMSVATVGAFAIALYSDGDYTEAVAVMLFYQTGELFQSYAVGRSRRNISELMDIRPDYANVMRGDQLEKVDPDEVESGSIIIVQPGEKVPIDGVIIEGRSSLNTAALTGESLPRDISEGDEIASGCINMTGLLKIRTTKPFGESTASRILELVENASSNKSRSESFIARFARVYTPVVCFSALALAVIPPFIRTLIPGVSAGWSMWIYRALTFLVVSCPCALVISIPLTFFAGLGGAGSAGILIKGSNYLEALSHTGCVVFDKTGTLTRGVFEVTDIHCISMDKGRLLELAALAESASSHPISQSLRLAYGRQLSLDRVSDIRELGGMGITAKADGIEVAVGNERLMKMLNVPCAECRSSGTVIHIAANGAYAGYIVVSDVIKPAAVQAISALKKIGIFKTVMLTGDSQAAAQQAAAQLGIDEVHSRLMPQDKVERVEELLANVCGRSKLAFVGDGINDAPVLSRADIGIAMGALGSDAAIEAADVVLIMDDDPIKIVKALRISRKCMRIVYENCFFAIGVKLLCLVLTALGITNMWLAIFADVGVMVLAVLNAIRALFVKKL